MNIKLLLLLLLLICYCTLCGVAALSQSNQRRTVSILCFPFIFGKQKPRYYQYGRDGLIDLPSMDCIY